MQIHSCFIHPSRLLRTLAVTVLAWGAASIPLLQAGPATRVSAAIWGDDALFDTVVTDTAFKAPPAHSIDRLYNFGESGLAGQRSVAESAPGDPEFNGGRWSVLLAVYTSEGLSFFDGDGDLTVDFELTNAEDVLRAVDMGLIELHPTGVYFECPMIPHRDSR